MLFGLSAPVIIGPMNGGMDYPPTTIWTADLNALLSSVLDLCAAFWNNVLPGKRQAALLLVANKRTYNALPAKLREKQVLELVENGVDLDLFRPESFGAKHENFRIIYFGRLVDWKRVDLLIDACNRLIGQ